MRRGTTPTHTFETDIDLSAAEVMYITYKQGDTVIMEKSIEDINVSPDKVEIYLTQEDTLAFAEYSKVSIQIRVRFPDGMAIASNIIDTTAERILKEGVI